MLTFSDRQNGDCWYPDSGATNHVTKDYNNITFGADFHGKHKVHMCNGISLPIKYCENTYLSCFNPTRSLSHKNIFHVSLITKNLLSVS